MILRFILSVAGVCILALPGVASNPVPLTDLFNTGVDDFGVPLTDNSFDLHYTFATPPPTGTVPIVATEANGFPIPPWLLDNSTSAWITPSDDTTGDIGAYTYRTIFTVPAGVDLSQVYLRGQLTSDNTTTAVLINGVTTGITGDGNFGAFGPAFTIQNNFVVGQNTLDFVVDEATGSAGAGGYTGVRVEITGAHAPIGEVGIPGLFNTGVNDSGAPLAEDAPETHFTLSGAVSGTPFVATSAGGFPIGPWLGDSSNSAWITPSADTNGPAGDYFYEVTFDLTGLNPATASILGQWSSDNEGVDILLNGAPTGNTNPLQFGAYSEFNISAEAGALFSGGLNTLTFQVNNAGTDPGPTGLRVEFLSASAAVIPEPSTALMGVCGGLLLFRRRREA